MNDPLFTLQSRTFPGLHPQTRNALSKLASPSRTGYDNPVAVLTHFAPGRESLSLCATRAGDMITLHHLMAISPAGMDRAAVAAALVDRDTGLHQIPRAMMETPGHEHGFFPLFCLRNAILAAAGNQQLTVNPWTCEKGKDEDYRKTRPGRRIPGRPAAQHGGLRAGKRLEA